ncbi:endonuclease/exonuclease/phosphatase (EEP) superfamily protein YafD [Glaciihabitans tibetensis]|uniref:Endonuclease/exonuclease/phosphatase (EEP) superfamily protein YafD n=1 Tax=Glaciihabitans tibetensis TaxID=1266600 RepID=A0A2T0VGT4_9MICO|nr:endonuclease/exonuclease/phosphatase family protein [Glaciihabitans tibetensis]PRY69436.1 endonuclease/exonuclease/phosphatase (EEP) superfamily protein YafD [Glaciihabitans tibetensis]
MIARLLSAAVTVVLAAALFVLAWPQLFGLEWSTPVAQAVSFRAIAVAGSAVMLIALLALAIFSVGARRFTGSIAIVFVIFGAISLAVLASRGSGSEDFATKRDSAVTVVAWNTLRDAPGADAIAAIALEEDADILTLSETSGEMGNAVAAIMAAAGRPMTVFAATVNEAEVDASTVLLVSSDLGAYSLRTDLGNTSVAASLVATPDDGSGPTIVGVHTMAPIPSGVDNWTSDLTWLADLCSGNTIMAGDFNATVDHMSRLASADGASLGECADAAMATDNAAVGTWPTQIPALLGTPIDHVLATDDWRVTGMRVIRSSENLGSDHRAIVAQLAPR